MTTYVSHYKLDRAWWRRRRCSCGRLAAHCERLREQGTPAVPAPLGVVFVYDGRRYGPDGGR